LTITAVKKVNQYLEVTDDGKTRRYSVDWSDCIVSAIMTGQYKLTNIYYDVAGAVFKATYTDGTTQTTVDISTGGGGGLTDIDGGKSDEVYGGVSGSPIDGGDATSF